jgi:hypothetical protein
MDTSMNTTIQSALDIHEEPKALAKVRRKAKPKAAPPADPLAELRHLVNQHAAMTKAKVSLGHMSRDRKNHVTGEKIECRLPDVARAELDLVAKTFAKQTLVIVSGMKKALKTIPIWEHFLGPVLGCGPVTAAYIITKLSMGGVERKSSAIRKYCGMAVIDGRADRHRKGETGSFSTVMRTQLYLMAMQGMRMAAGKTSTSKYLNIWRDAKHRKLNSEQVVDGKINGAPANAYADAYGRRKMLDVFLEDLYIIWRTLDGLPVWPSYYAAKLGYEHGGKISVNAPKMLTLEEAKEIVGFVGAIPVERPLDLGEGADCEEEEAA